MREGMTNLQHLLNRTYAKQLKPDESRLTGFVVHVCMRKMHLGHQPQLGFRQGEVYVFVWVCVSDNISGICLCFCHLFVFLLCGLCTGQRKTVVKKYDSEKKRVTERNRKRERIRRMK